MQLFKNVSVTKKMLAMFLAFCCVCGVLSVPVSASAAVDNATVATVEPRRTTIYPSSGQSSGYFFEVKSQTATYNYLPKDTEIHITYSYDNTEDNGGRNDTLCFEYNGRVVKTVTLSRNDGISAEATVKLPYDGKYVTYVTARAYGAKYFSYILSY
ncbi:MAG: hypothetical protein K1W33_04700 [Clostridia bacterium]